MAKSLEEVIPAGPFEDAIVNSPREVEPPVPGLNDDALDRVVRVFERLRAQEPPHPPVKAPAAQCIFSPAPGYGKSHLLGRLFRKLGPRATRVYVHPFEEASYAWTSLLRITIQELTKPESGDEVARLPGAADQLDAIAHGVLGHALALVIREGPVSVDGLPNAEAILTRGISSEWDLGDPNLSLTRAFSEIFEGLLPHLRERITGLGISFSSHWSSPDAWLRVLFHYAAARGHDPTLRDECLTWLRGHAYRGEDFSALGLRSKDLVPSELPVNEVDSISRARLLDLCQLTSFYRPFLFCFDQTETYRRDSSLAWSFGHIICTLVNEARNQLCVITANQEVWARCIEPHFEDAHKARFDRPITMEGITPDQGRELVKARLKRFDVGDEEIRRFQKALKARDDAGGGEKRASVRKFIHHCNECLHEIAGGNRPPEPTLNDLFRQEYEECRRNENDLKEYNSELFRWILLNGIGAERTRTPHGYFPLAYTATDGRPLLFGLEEGANHNRWLARLREAKRQHQQQGALSIHLRLEGQRSIPGNWKCRHEFEEAKDYFRIHVLSRDQIAEIRALWNLYSKACQQDIPFSESEVLHLVAERLGPLKQKVVGEASSRRRSSKAPKGESAEPKEAAGSDSPTASDSNPGSDSLRAAISEIVRSHRFIAFSGLQQSLERRFGRPVPQSEAVEACEGHDHITVKLHPSNAVFLWQ